MQVGVAFIDSRFDGIGVKQRENGICKKLIIQDFTLFLEKI